MQTSRHRTSNGQLPQVQLYPYFSSFNFSLPQVWSDSGFSGVAGTYFVMVKGYNTETGTFTLTATGTSGTAGASGKNDESCIEYDAFCI